MRVDGTASGPSGAKAADKEEQRRRGGPVLTTCVGKRSFKRAIARARITGQTFYKGRILYPNMQYAPAPPVQSAAQQARIQIMSWNAGGLSSEGTTEFEHFLKDSNFAVALVQETHWSSSGEWVKGDWTFIHSASKRPRQDGVMVAIRTSLLTSGEVSWQEIIPGRLLRVRAILGQQQWDFFSLYQRAMSSGAAADKDKLLERRGLIWNPGHAISLNAPNWRGFQRQLDT